MAWGRVPSYSDASSATAPRDRASGTRSNKESSAPAENPASETDVSGTRRALAEVCSTPLADINDGDRLGEELGLDSLGLVELLSAIEADLGIFIDEGLLSGETTVARLEELVAGQTELVSSPDLNRLPLSRAAPLLRRALHSGLISPSLRLLARPKVTGLENLKDVQGPVVFTANHSSHLDSLAVLSALPSRLRDKTAVAAAEDHFFAAGLSALLRRRSSMASLLRGKEPSAPAYNDAPTS